MLICLLPVCFVEKTRLTECFSNTGMSYVPSRLFLAPVTFGAQAFAWAAGKLETNGNGLPTSPSSSDVQNRVLQAAAKHESQPPDTEGVQDPSPEGVQDAAPESTISLNEKVDLSEA